MISSFPCLNDVFRHDPFSLAWVETGLHLSSAYKISNKGLPYPFDHPLPLLLGPVAQLETAAGRAFSYTF
jgi:hypothetical protein